MELRQIKYFIEVAKREHVTEAAHELHVAQSAISRHISQLEAELEVDLFYREGRNVKLTHIGRRFLEHAERSLTELENGRQEIQEFLDPEQGEIRLGFSTSLSLHTLPMVLAQFRDEHPNIQFRLQQGSLNYLIDMIGQGDINLAFAAPVPSENDTVEGGIFYTEKLMVVVPDTHHLAYNEQVRLDQLRQDRFVTFHRGLSLHQILVNACKQVGFEPQIAFEGEDTDTIKSLVSAGFGVALLPEQTLSNALPRDTVKIPVSEPNVTRTVGLIKPKNRELTPSEELFNQFVGEFYDRLSRFEQ